MANFTLRGISDNTMNKLRKRKQTDGFGNKDWAEWITWLVKDMRVESTSGEQLQSQTQKALLSTWMENFAKNIPEMNASDAKILKDLVPKRDNIDNPFGTGIVVGRGPSVFNRGHLKMLAESDYKGVILVTDGMLLECLRAGVTPDKGYRNFVVCSVDGNREKIVRWYGDPDFEEHNPKATKEDIEKNTENIKLVNNYSKKITTVLATSVAHNVYQRAKAAGIEIIWFHPMFDDWRRNESFSRLMTLMTKTKEHPRGIAKMSCGGNAGSTIWIMSHALFRHKVTALIGIDLGYPDGTPLDQTVYYDSMMKATGGDVQKVKMAYREVVNPSGDRAYADLVFWNYRESLLDMAKDVNPKFETWNCTGGGIVYGDPIKWKTFEEFLKTYKE